LKKYWHKLSLLLCFLVAIVFSLKNLREPDLWWQIRTGEWILHHHDVPRQDVFSYTYQGAYWINIKWGFEVLAAMVCRLAGPESIFLIQAIVTCLIIFFLIKAGRQFSENETATGNIAVVIALISTLLAFEYRITGRPEMFSHLFTAVFLYLLLQYRRMPGYGILLIAPLQVIWANFHEAFAIGIIMTAIFCAGGWLEYYLAKRKILTLKAVQPRELTIAFIVSIICVAINPYGTKLLLRPLSILGQVYENKFTTELANFQSYQFWHWNTYLGIAILFIAAIGTAFYFFNRKTKHNRFKLFVEHFGIGYLLTLPAFIYLAATAYRNIAFLMLVGFPLLVFGFNALICGIPGIQKIAPKITVAIVVLQLVLYGGIVSDKYYEITNSHDRYGLEMLSTSNPAGAADFVHQNKLRGRCFSDYLTSSYLLWKLQPEFKTYIDLRDLDVFPTGFFTTFAEAVTYPDEFVKQDSIYHFSYVVLYRPQFAALHNYLFNESRFKLVFADPVAAVYVPKTSGDSLTVNFSKPKRVEASLFSFGFSKLFNPFYKPFDYAKVDNDLLAATYFLSAGQLDEAEKYARKSATNNIENFRSLKMLGDISYRRIRSNPNPGERGRMLGEALNYFQQSINLKNDYADGYLGEGAVLFEQRNMQRALECFEQCILLDKDNLDAYLSAGSCCNYFVNANGPEADEYARKAIAFYRKANYLNPDNPTIMLNLGFLYARLNDCDKVVKYLSKIADFPGLSDGQREQVRQCLMHCGK
jgi:tetratricopeptide (TPR) repeat protein